ncbi:hypothetical protein [Prosthecobacter sp.]|jgi:hypothetical protein|uniref:hypothetical protein n=1 Tax=Prosthecobacter sp. TaxID=1965333 RepID=UPI0037846D30
MLTTTRHPGVVHTGYHTYKPVHGVLGFMMSCGASVILLWVLLHFFKEDEISPQNMQIAAGLSVIGCLLFFLGTTWFFSFITGYSLKLSIGEGGIRYGVAFFSWPQVSAIGARMKRGSFQVHVTLSRGWFSRRWLMTDDGMTREMAQELIEELRRQILPRFPRLEITRLPELTQAVAIAHPAEMPDGESSAEPHA